MKNRFADHTNEIVYVNQFVAYTSMGIASMRMTFKWRRNVKVALQAAPVNETARFLHGEHGPATRTEVAAISNRSLDASYWCRAVVTRGKAARSRCIATSGNAAARSSVGTLSP